MCWPRWRERSAVDTVHRDPRAFLPATPRRPVDRNHSPGAERRAVPRLERAHRSEEHTSELQSLAYLVCRLLLEKKKNTNTSQLYVVAWTAAAIDSTVIQQQ